jgi:PD-(D/E)XK nuclease superfamily protein
VRYPNGSASATTRTLMCPSWLAFSHADSDSPHAVRGTVIHRYGKAVLTGTPVARALEAVKDPATRETCAAIDWHKIGGDLSDISCEVSYIVNVRERTARFIGVDIGREYEKDGPLGEWDVPGSIDILGNDVDGRPRITDIKTGFLDVEPAAYNGQGLMLASAVHLAHDAPEVEFRISSVKTSGKVWNDSAVHTAFDFDGFLDELEAALVASKEAKRVYLAKGTPDVNEGEWCRYCPALTSGACPAKQALVRSMLPDLVAVEGTLATATPEQLGEAWVLGHDRMKPLLERVLDLIKERARQERLPLPDGRELRESLSSSERLHAESLLALARKRGATEEEIAECYRESPVSRIIAAKPIGAAKAPRRPRALKPKEVA